MRALSPLTNSKTTYFKASYKIKNTSSFDVSHSQVVSFGLLLAKWEANWFDSPNSKPEVYIAFSEKLTHTASGITWILCNYSHFSLHGKSSHSGWVWQCPKSGDLRTGRNLRHHTKAFPSLSTATQTPIMNTSAPFPRGQLQSLDHFRIQPLPPPHPHPTRRAFPLDVFFPLRHLQCTLVLFLLLSLLATRIRWSSVFLLFSSPFYIMVMLSEYGIYILLYKGSKTFSISWVKWKAIQ